MSARAQGGKRLIRGSAATLESVLHPAPLGALALMVINDHVLKPNHPGWLSGKLSDIAVLVLLPFLLVAIADLARPTRLQALGGRAVVASVIIAMAAFVVIEIVPVGGESYRWSLGALQWPVRATVALATGGTVPAIAPVRLTSDLTDLLTLPAALAILAVTRPDGRTWWRR